MLLCMGWPRELPTTLTRGVWSAGRSAHDGKVEHSTDQAAAHRAQLGCGSVQRHSRRAVGGTNDDRDTTITGLPKGQVQWHLAKQWDAELVRQLHAATRAEQ